MKTRTTLILAVIAIALGAYIYFHERHTLSQSEVEARGTHLLKHFVRARLTTVTVERGGRRWTLERILGADESVDLHVWRVAAPVRDAADDEAVNALLGSLEWGDARRTLVDLTAADLHEFGLDHPRLRATLRVANEDIRLTLGAEVPGGEGVYVSIGEPATAYIVGKDFFEALDFDVDHFRSKVLFDGRSAAGAVRVTLRNATGSYEFDRPDGHRWWVRQPSVAYASPGAVEAALNTFESLHAQRFVAENLDQLARYGLDPADMDVHATMSRPDGGAASSMRIRVGHVCEGHPTELYAVTDNEGPVMCVTATEVEAFRVGSNMLYEQHLVLTPDDSVERIQVATEEQHVEITRSDEGWKFHTHDDVRGDADEAAVARFMADLRAARMVTSSAGEASSVVASLPATPANLAAQHLDHPYATITITKTENGGTESVVLGNSDASGTWVRRGDEPLILRMEGSLVSLFEPSPIHVRPLRVITEDDARAVRFRVTRGQFDRETVELADGRWTVIEPERVIAERSLCASFLRRFGTLSAERFVASEPTMEMRTARPRYTVEATFGTATPGQVHAHMLRIYDSAPGGAQALLDEDHAVFVVSQDFVNELEARFASRDLLSTEVANVAAIRVERGRTHTDLPATDANRASPAYQTVATLHAVGVAGYDGNIGAVRATVVVTRTEGSPVPHAMRILIGAQEGEGDTALVRVRREDLPLVFRVPASSLSTFLGESL